MSPSSMQTTNLYPDFFGIAKDQSTISHFYRAVMVLVDKIPPIFCLARFRIPSPYVRDPELRRPNALV